MSEFWDAAKSVYAILMEHAQTINARGEPYVHPLLTEDNRDLANRSTFVIEDGILEEGRLLLRKRDWPSQTNAMGHQGESALLALETDARKMQTNLSFLAQHEQMRALLSGHPTLKQHSNRLLYNLVNASDLYSRGHNDLTRNAGVYASRLNLGLLRGNIAIQISHRNPFEVFEVPDEVVMIGRRYPIFPFTFEGGNRLYTTNGQRLLIRNAGTPLIGLFPDEALLLPGGPLVQGHGFLYETMQALNTAHGAVAEAGIQAKNTAKALLKSAGTNKGFKKTWVLLFADNLSDAFIKMGKAIHSPAFTCLIGIGIAGALMAHSSNAHASEESAHPATESAHDDGMNIANFALHGVLGFISPEAEMGLTVAEMVGLV